MSIIKKQFIVGGRDLGNRRGSLSSLGVQQQQQPDSQQRPL